MRPWADGRYQLQIHYKLTSPPYLPPQFPISPPLHRYFRNGDYTGASSVPAMNHNDLKYICAGCGERRPALHCPGVLSSYAPPTLAIYNAHIEKQSEKPG